MAVAQDKSLGEGTVHISRAAMVLIPQGSFLMGSDGWGEFESPVHEVYLDDFWMDETPVTNAQFAQFAAETGYETGAERAGGAWGFGDSGYAFQGGLSWQSHALPERGDQPVVLVSWNDAQAYAQWAGKRLPTEAEWEKAAHGPGAAQLFPWGYQAPTGVQSNFARPPAHVPPTTPVRQFPANGYGLYDLVGNVWQWCADWYSNGYYADSPGTNPPGPPSGVTRVRRGGSWNVIQAFRLRCANRGAMPPSDCAPNVGFRCVSCDRAVIRGG
jgi:formylglycine-generating enzyme required for sulfatase activity